MGAPYETQTRLHSPMARFAATLSGSRLHSLVLMSDPDRTPDLLELVTKLPSHSAIIYRHFGKTGLEKRLRTLTESREIQFLVGNDPELAHKCGADGVHFSRRVNPATVQRWRQARPGWIISMAGPKNGNPLPQIDGLDAIIMSSIFSSDSQSAGTPIGVEALKLYTEQSPSPVFALGGVSAQTVLQLSGINIAGIAAIDGLAQELRQRHERQSSMKKPIIAKSDNPVSITREEMADMIIFTATVRGATETGELTLKKVADEVWNANHTGVPSEIGGRGVGKALVEAMVEDARQQGYRVIPGCPFVAKLFERKPGWAEGVAA